MAFYLFIFFNIYKTVSGPKDSEINIGNVRSIKDLSSIWNISYRNRKINKTKSFQFVNMLYSKQKDIIVGNEAVDELIWEKLFCGNYI